MVDTEATACATELMTPTGSTGLLALGDAAGGVTFGGAAGVELPDAATIIKVLLGSFA